MDAFDAEALLSLLQPYVDGLDSLASLQPVLDGILSSLRDQLLAPLERYLRDRLAVAAAVLIPGGQLGLLPLHAALADDLEVTYAPSARTLNAARRALAGVPAGHGTLAGIADPQPAAAPLPYAALELAGIAALFEPAARQLLVRAEATPTALLRELPGARYVHLACHGEANLEQPLDSRLLLAGADLSLRDILIGVSLEGSRLVTLSACQTAVVEFRRLPDEMLGLPAGFLQAGAPCVVASLWRVEDLSTALLMIRFYQLHLCGDVEEGLPPLAPAAALRRAQQWLRQVTVRDLGRYLKTWRPRDDGGTATAIEETLARMSAQAMTRLAIAPPDSRPFRAPAVWAPFLLLGE